jgi:hypothetical protein
MAKITATLLASLRRHCGVRQQLTILELVPVPIVTLHKVDNVQPATGYRK